MRLEIAVEDGKASGSLAIGGLGGTFYTFKDGKVTGNEVQIKIDPRPDPAYTIELVDDNTVLLIREPRTVVGNNVLDLIAVLVSINQPQSVVAVPGGASIDGSVRDPGGAFIPGVTVTAINTETGARFRAVTDEAGAYSIPSVPPGKYTVIVSFPGFKTATVSDLSVGNSPVVQDATLELPEPLVLTEESCSPVGIVWCRVLHRAK